QDERINELHPGRRRRRVDCRGGGHAHRWCSGRRRSGLAVDFVNNVAHRVVHLVSPVFVSSLRRNTSARSSWPPRGGVSRTSVHFSWKPASLSSPRRLRTASSVPM